MATRASGPDDWRALIAAKLAQPRRVARAETYLTKWESFSMPVLVECDDRQEYVIKGRQIGRAVVNEHVVARLGHALGAPVGEPAFVDVPAELIALESELRHIPPGIAHGSPFLRDCSDRLWIEHTGAPENRERFARLAVLYGWMHAGDRQLIYANAAPHLVHSVDHGHFFPGGPYWTISSLAVASPAAPERQIMESCFLRDHDLDGARTALDAVDDVIIAGAVAGPPDEWNLSMVERIALATYLARRRDDLLAR